MTRLNYSLEGTAGFELVETTEASLAEGTKRRPFESEADGQRN
jgi:hypothetical protein